MTYTFIMHNLETILLKLKLKKNIMTTDYYKNYLYECQCVSTV